MKLFLTVLSMIFIFSSCKNESEKDVQEEIYLEEENSEDENNPNREKQNKTSSKQKDPSGLNSPKEESDSENTSSPTKSIAGNYIKVGQESDSNCSCYCLDVQFNTNSELCLTPDKMYINVKFEKVDENLVNVYLLNPSDINAEGDEIPWSKFDRNSPVATLTSQNNGDIDFDWLGFKINGDLAQDYALYGKKTLEGTFKKK